MLAAQVAIQSRQIEGVVEADWTFFRISFKGHRSWKKGKPPEDRRPRGPRRTRLRTLFGRTEGSYRRGAEERLRAPPDPPAAQGLAGQGVGGKPRKPGRLGYGPVNAHHGRLKTFINREARGVGTNCLQYYLAWARVMRWPWFGPPVLIEQALAA